MLKSKAIVLSRIDFAEYDSIVTFYSLDFGKISIIAKGLKRPSSKLAAHLEPLNLVDLMIIEGRERRYVGSAISENSFLKIKSNYSKLLIAGQAIKFIKDLSFENQQDFNLFLLLKDFLINLNNSNEDLNFLDFSLLYFKIRLINFLGYDFDFSTCSTCGKHPAIFLNFFDKEVICLNCSNFHKNLSSHCIKISQSTINLKNNILSSNLSEIDFSNFSLSQKKELNNFINIIRKII